MIASGPRAGAPRRRGSGGPSPLASAARHPPKNLRSGQSTVEWALVVSVLVIALVAAAYVFIPSFQAEMQRGGGALRGLYTSGDLAR